VGISKKGEDSAVLVVSIFYSSPNKYFELSQTYTSHIIHRQRPVPTAPFRFSDIIMHLTALLLSASAALAAPFALSPRETSLAPWQLTALNTFSPSGNPGNYPWSTITLSLTDPNTLTLGPANSTSPITIPADASAKNCAAKWIIGETPFGRSWPCEQDGSSGWWTLEIVETADFDVGRFDAVITRVVEKRDFGSGEVRRRVFKAREHFGVGENMSGQCGGSGVCSWHLGEGVAPYDVQQEEIVGEEKE
jgi:hypothetical protein